MDGPDRSYRVFGGVLRTPLNLPELHLADEDAAASWVLSVRPESELPAFRESATSREELAGGVSVSLSRGRGGEVRMTYSDTGTFVISRDGSRIVWYRPERAPEDLARTDILGRVLAMAGHVAGMMMLHASGVSIDGRAVGFLAPKFFGKSTLACALTDRGASLVTDDTLALRVRADVECAPGIPSLRLRHEAATFLRGRRPSPEHRGDWRHFERREEHEVASDWLPLSALYLLAPAPPESMSSGAERVRIAPLEAALALVRHAKLGALIAGDLAAEYLDYAARVASRVPLYRLEYPRNLDRLDDVSAVVDGWHRSAAA